MYYRDVLSRIAIVVVTIAGAILLVINVILMSCYVRRRQRRHKTGEAPGTFIFFDIGGLRSGEFCGLPIITQWEKLICLKYSSDLFKSFRTMLI